jgi:hypothetical protein
LIIGGHFTIKRNRKITLSLFIHLCLNLRHLMILH